MLFLSEFYLNLLNLNNAKRLKSIREELMPVAWHPKRRWNLCMSENKYNE